MNLALQDAQKQISDLDKSKRRAEAERDENARAAEVTLTL